MNTQSYGLIFNASRGCMMAVAETASNASKSSSSTTRARRRSSKCKRSPASPKTDKFDPSKPPSAQQIQARAATNSIVSNTARGSAVNAGNNINITATGAGKDSNILIQGSDIKAGNNASLLADNRIDLLAAKNETSQQSTNSSSSGSIGVSLSTQGLSATASASKGKGKSDGQGTSCTNARVGAGNAVVIQSGGDANIKGAVVAANQIKADIGGNLKIESLQDTNTYSASQKSSGFSLSVPITGGDFGASVSASKSKIDSNFQSVKEQSGFKAGDGGFQVSVANNTSLTGGVIASTQTAVDGKANTFTTGGALTITDVQNTASFKGTAVGGTIGVGSQLGSSGAGVGKMQGSAASTTTSGISGIAGNQAVRTGDAETGLKPIFNADKVQKDIDAQVKITTAFGQQGAKAIGDYAGKKLKEADAKLAQAEAADKAGQTDLANERRREAQDLQDTWGEGKLGRVFLHTALGGLTGNFSGAIGAGVTQAAIPYIGEQIAKLDVPLEVKQAFVQISSGLLGAAVGGPGGAASALNATSQNYLSHQERNNLRTRYDNCKNSTGSISACQRQVVEDYAAKSVDNDKALLIACINAQSPQCRTAMTESIDYAADRRMDNYGRSSDRLRSGQVNFAQAYSLPDGQGVNYYTDRTARNNFYRAVQDVVTDKGSTVMWPQMAADVTANSRLGMHDFITCQGGIGTGTVMCGASKEINTAIFGDAFTHFSTGLLFGAPVTGTAADRFDRNMVTREQVAAQPTWVRVQREVSGRPLGEWTLIGAGAAIPKLFPWQMPAMPGAFNNGTMFNQDARIQYGNQLVDQYRARPAPNQTTQPNSTIKTTP